MIAEVENFLLTRRRIRARETAMSAGHARNSYLVRVEDTAGSGLAPGLYRFLRDGKVERIEDPEFFSHQSGEESYAYKYLFAIQNDADLPSEAAVTALGAAMMLPDGDVAQDSNIPAGYTYLGQFIFHDMTFMDLKGGGNALRNLRTPALDLDSVLRLDGALTAPMSSLGPLPSGCTTPDGIPIPEDLPRETSGGQIGNPTIIDGRNDTFLPLAQSHLMLTKFYNAVARWLGFGCGAEGDEFSAEWRGVVRKLWLQHFQSAVLHDYLARIIDPATHADVLANGRRVVAPGAIAQTDEWLPLEFAAAIGRFGHSMIRDLYQPWNRGHPEPVDVIRFMDFSYRYSGDHLSSHGGGLPRNWVADWYRLLDLAGAGDQPLMAARIDTRLASPLGILPQCLRDDFCQGDLHAQPQFDLATQNLLRGRRLKLATAQQAVLQANAVIGTQHIPLLSADDLIPDGNGAVADAFVTFPELADKTPLWYYVLREAELIGDGCKLGPLGSRIIMETVHGAIESSKDSILAETAWSPSLPAAQQSHFSLSDLVLFTGNPDPLGAYAHAIGEV